jgi:phenylpropionate dioxygenase-like ring-hydroxylating dioxygenase large terminal subunit
VGGKSILLTRDSQGEFRAFVNACRHRGMELVSKEAPAGNKRLHICPYHAWAYGSDGSLMSVPFEEGFADEDGEHAAERGGLIALQSAEKAGLLLLVPNQDVSQERFQSLIAQSFPPELLAELELFNIGAHKKTVEQVCERTDGPLSHYINMHMNYRCTKIGSGQT